MSVSIKLYIGIKETRQNEQIKILNTLEGYKKKILHLKQDILRQHSNININIHFVSGEYITVTYRRNDYPPTLSFFFPEEISESIPVEERNNPDPINLLDRVYKIAKEEYDSIANRVLNVRSRKIGASKKLFRN